jgi:uncharacterized protein
MNAWFADTFYFLALLDREDEDHDRAMTVIEQLSNKLVTTAWVLTEVADGLSRHQHRAQFLALVQLLQAHPLVEIIPPSQFLFEQGIELYSSRLDKDWSLTDCISFVVMRKQGLTEALTGDRHFEQAGFTALLA